MKEWDRAEFDEIMYRSLPRICEHTEQ